MQTAAWVAHGTHKELGHLVAILSFNVLHDHFERHHSTVMRQGWSEVGVASAALMNLARHARLCLLLTHMVVGGMNTLHALRPNAVFSIIKSVKETNETNVPKGDNLRVIRTL
jgi:hypothetical protein